jgi:isopenicillin N synthase-like dioxygenase
MLDLGKRMFPLLALALELEEDFFDDKVGTLPLA